jgi:hypothetical protein
MKYLAPALSRFSVGVTLAAGKPEISSKSVDEPMA